MNNHKTIMIIEDEEGLCDMLAANLGHAGYHTLIANDGENGLKYVLEKKPDLVILDLGLPKLTGEEVCKEIKDNYDKSLASIPIIIMTAKDTDGDRVFGKAIGADAYLTKPFSLECLMNEILRLLPAWA